MFILKLNKIFSEDHHHHKEEYENPDAEIEELLDLIVDKKSPWFETIDWSANGDSIRQTFIKDISRLNLNSIEQCFTSLRLNDKNVITKS